jgi:hypothetical protein
MTRKAPITERDLFEIESVAVDATPGPWEPQTVLDFQTGEATLAVVRVAEDDDECEIVVERELELSLANQRYIAAMHPDKVLHLVKELKRLRRVEERMETMLTLMSHLNEFLERRNLTAQAQRFVEVRAQLENIHPEVLGEPAESPLQTSGQIN